MEYAGAREMPTADVVYSDFRTLLSLPTLRPMLANPHAEPLRHTLRPQKRKEDAKNR